MSGYLLQNVLKFATSLSYKKPCLSNLHVGWWCLVNTPGCGSLTGTGEVAKGAMKFALNVLCTIN